MTTIATTIKNVDTVPMLDAQAMSLLFGVGLDAINELPFETGHATIPTEWLKRGRRRTKEATAATGSAFILDVLQFWAQRDHGANLEVVYA